MNSQADRSVVRAPIGTTKRKEQTAEVVRRYTVEHQSIRVISAALGWSYGKTHGLLVESGTPIWPRGGGSHARRVPTAACELPLSEYATPVGREPMTAGAAAMQTPARRSDSC
jgi:hypothetical protein